MSHSRHVLLCTVVMIGFGCGGRRQPEPVQHLGSGLTDWTHVAASEREEVALDGLWGKSSAGTDSGRIVYQAQLENAIDIVGDVPQATAELRGKRLPVERFRGTDSLREGVVFIDPGRDFFSGLEADLRGRSGATCAVDLRAGTVWVEVLARGKSALGVPPKMAVFLNRGRIGQFDVTAQRPYIAAGSAVSGTNSVEVRFTNDYYDPPEDRNLYVRDVRMVQPAIVYVVRPARSAPQRGLKLQYGLSPVGSAMYRRIEPAPGLSDGVGPWRYYEMGNETLPGIPVPPPGEVRFRLKPGPKSKLEVAYGVISPTGEIAAGAVVFEAYGVSGTKRSLLDRLRVQPDALEETHQWVKRVYDLGAFAGREIELFVSSRLHVDAAEDETSRGERPVAVVCEPVMVTPNADGGAVRNVILVSIDTLRADHLSCYGYKVPTSPVLDAFAEEHILFETVIAQSCWTLPSHVAMLSSLYVSAHGVSHRNRSIRSLEVLASILKREGFRTKAIVDGGYIAPAFGFCLGFDSYEDHRHTGFKSILPAAEEWLRAHHEDPFFLFLHTYDVHSPYHPPKRFRDRFPPPDGASPILVNGIATYRLPESGTPEQRAVDLRHIVNMYDAGIMYADEQMGRFFDLLTELGKWDDTMVIVTSDHGEEFMEHGGMNHGETLFEEALRVPLLVHVPEVRGARRVADLVQIIDIPPTVLDYLSIDPGVDFQGESLLQYLDGEPSAPRAAYAEEVRHNLVARRYRDEKFIYDTRAKSALLYDLASDPGEQENLALQDRETVTVLIEDLEAFEKDNAGLSSKRTAGDVEISDELAESLRQLGYMH